MAGDFRQTLPIIRRDTRADQVRSCVKSSYLWDHVETLFFSTNMRAFLSGDQKAAAFFESYFNWLKEMHQLIQVGSLN